MIDRKKLRIMTRLAIYDKRDGGKDRKTCEYFSSDFVYKKNMWTRVGVFIGALIVLLFFWLHKIYVKEVDILTLDVKAEGIKAGLFVAAVLVFYTVLGTVKTVAEYSQSQKRLQKYFTLLGQADKLSQAQRSGERYRDSMAYEPTDTDEEKNKVGELSYVRRNISDTRNNHRRL